MSLDDTWFVPQVSNFSEKKRRGNKYEGINNFPYIRVDKLMHTFPGAIEHYTVNLNNTFCLV